MLQMIRPSKRKPFENSGSCNSPAAVETPPQILNLMSTQNQEAGREMAEAATDVLDFSLIAMRLLKTIKTEEKKYKEPKTFKEAYFHEDRHREKIGGTQSRWNFKT